MLCVLVYADPENWDCRHTKHWLQWVAHRFGLYDVDVDSFLLNGAQMMRLQYDEFAKYIPNDSGNVCWTHLELLKKYKFVGKSPICLHCFDIVMECGSYRGIKWLEHAMKVIERIFEYRIRQQIEINDMQFGFMKGKGTTDAIFMARQMQENFRVKG